MQHDKDDIEELEDSYLFFYYRKLNKKNNRKISKKKSFWVRDIFRERINHGVSRTLYQELKIDREYHYRFLRMTQERFSHVLSLVQGKISKRNTPFRDCISAEQRLVLTLRYLACWETQQSLSFSFRIGRQTVSPILSETWEAIYDALKDTYISLPKGKSQWVSIANKFEEVWNFPHVIGAIDGKHVRIQCPKKSDSLFHNYKGFYSIVLLAICDANYCFTMFDLGEYGSNNDSSILANSEMGNGFTNSTLGVLDAEELNGCSLSPLPYVLVGDEIFPLKTWLMRPFPGKNMTEEQRIYNYRHSRARRVIENAFGILTARWRIFSVIIRASVQNTEKYVLACLVLHNYRRQTCNATYTPQGFVDTEDFTGNIIDGMWRAELINNTQSALQSLTNIRGSRYREEALKMRDELKNYVNSENGNIFWQLDYI